MSGARNSPSQQLELLSGPGSVKCDTMETLDSMDYSPDIIPKDGGEVPSEPRQLRSLYLCRGFKIMNYMNEKNNFSTKILKFVFPFSIELRVSSEQIGFEKSGLPFMIDLFEKMYS